jgi:hypothetical protein
MRSSHPVALIQLPHRQEHSRSYRPSVLYLKAIVVVVICLLRHQVITDSTSANLHNPLQKP